MATQVNGIWEEIGVMTRRKGIDWIDVSVCLPVPDIDEDEDVSTNACVIITHDQKSVGLIGIGGRREERRINGNEA
ncbi:hypothetical protein J6590_020603 [Homalodisca vitripennis]|nr:hypothetical protein J6590_020603 [Homalodisca vitripennis]